MSTTDGRQQQRYFPIAEMIQKFQELCREGKWDDLVETCYFADAKLSHFALMAAPAATSVPPALQGRKAIKDFFASGPFPGGYKLELKYSVVELEEPNAVLVAGAGRVNDGGGWCPFVERWELDDASNNWRIVEDKVYAPEPWME